MTPERCRPGIGLRPGEPDHPAARLVPALYATLYDSIADHARLGPNVVIEVGHHDVAILSDCARGIVGLDALPVGIRRPVEVILGRRADSPAGTYASCPSRRADAGAGPPLAADVHVPGIYDFEVDTPMLGPAECAAAIATAGRRREPTSFRRLPRGDVG